MLESFAIDILKEDIKLSGAENHVLLKDNAKAIEKIGNEEPEILADQPESCSSSTRSAA